VLGPLQSAVMKRKPGVRSPPSRSAPTTVDEYLARVPEPGRSVLTKLRATIRSVLPRDATEPISYQMPAFKGNRGVIVWYAAFADHVSLFPRASVIAAFKGELAGYKTSKGTIQFPLDKPLPVALIKRIVKARLTEHETSKRR
jgi:uncharacterized protein YdhG (YjbR/CyaY superfamily)